MIGPQIEVDPASGKPYRVLEYTFESLLQYAFEDTRIGRTAEEIRRQNNKVKYLEEYLSEKGIGAKTFVIEFGYNDREYLADFSAYYVLSFTHFRKETRRIHFFSCSFSESEFELYLSSRHGSVRIPLEADNAYLGFIVVKPLPQSLMGRTCLATYEPDDNASPNRKRHYPIARNYKVNLFGIPLTIRSVAFQEQDSEVAACATVAVWTLLHASAEKFPHKPLSPYEITLLGTQHIPESSFYPQTRRFPSEGLSALQAAGVMRAVGIEPTLIGCAAESVDSDQIEKIGIALSSNSERNYSTRQIVNRVVASYCDFGAPIYMAAIIWEDSMGEPRKRIGAHAMTALGYAVKEDTAECAQRVRGDRIVTLYVHDDQAGPFARYGWEDDKTLVNYPKSPGKGRTIYAYPDCLIIPLPPKVRVRYDSIERAVEELDVVLDVFSGALNLTHWEWGFRLWEINDFKDSIRRTLTISEHDRLRLLTRQLPRYVWTLDLQCSVDGKPSAHADVEILIDATALAQESGLLELLFSAPCRYLEALALEWRDSRVDSASFQSKLARTVIERFRSHVEAVS